MRRFPARVVHRVGRAYEHAGEELTRWPFRRGGLRVHRHREWTDELDAVLRELPIDDTYGPEAHRVAAQHVDGVEKVHALVTDAAGDPQALISLRRRRRHWEPVTEQCLPDAAIPARPGAARAALGVVGLEIQLDVRAGRGPELGAIETWHNDSYCADISPGADFEAHWRSSSHWKNVRSARNRTAHLAVRRDHLDDIDWVVRSWAANWQDDGGDAVRSTEDRIAVWRHQFAAGKVQSIVLLDDGEPVAGAVNLAIGDRMTGQCLTRDRSFPIKSVGHRVIDEGFSAAREAGYRWFDLGGGVDYKRVWAPVYEVRCVAVIEPRWRRVGRRLRASVDDGGDPRPEPDHDSNMR